MDDAALLELPDDPILLKRLIIERDQTIAHHAATLKERDESIQLLSQDNQLLTSSPGGAAAKQLRPACRTLRSPATAALRPARAED